MSDLKVLEVKMSAENYPQILELVCQQNKSYIYQNDETQDIAIGQFTAKNDPEPIEKGYHPLNFRDITLCGYDYKNKSGQKLGSNKIVSTVLHKMVERKEKNEKNRNGLIAIIHLICDCIKNFFSGYGFYSSVYLAKRLIKYVNLEIKAEEAEIVKESEIEAKQIFENEIEKKEIKLKDPSQIELLIPNKPIELKKLVTEKNVTRPPLLRDRSVTAGKKTALEHYLKDPAKCPLFYTKMIYQDMKLIEQKSNSADTTSVVGLMKYASGIDDKDSVDLRDDMCARVLLDTIRFCNKETSGQLTEWLIKEKTFHPALLMECFKIFLKFDNEQKPYNEFALQTLVKIYVEREWNKLKDIEGDPLFPSNNHLLVSVMSQLINKGPNDNLVEKWASWFIEQKEFDITTFAAWIRIFKTREETKSVGVSIYYPLRNSLMAYLDNQTEWKEKLKDTDLAVYLGLKPPPVIVDIPKVPKIPKSKDKPISFETAAITLEERKLKIPPITKKVTAGKISAMEDYKKDPNNCSLLHRNIIFQDVKHIENPVNSGDQTISVVGLMKHFSGLTEVDLHNEVCAQVILDILRCCNKNTSEAVIHWLTNQKTFHVSLLKRCIYIFKSMESLDGKKAYSLFALETLIRHYIDQEWNRVKGGDGKPIVPTNDPIIVAGISQMINNQPNDPVVTKSVMWMMDQNDFDLPIMIEWIRLFMHREQMKSTGAPMCYPLRDELFAYLNKREEWVEFIKNSETTKDIAFYGYGISTTSVAALQ
jgi:hypothetical protein